MALEHELQRLKEMPGLSYTESSGEEASLILFPPNKELTLHSYLGNALGREHPISLGADGTPRIPIRKAVCNTT